MKKGFELVLEEIKAKTEKSSVFSLTDFKKLMASFLNEDNYEMEFVKSYDKENNKIVKEKVLPVKDFKEFLIKILTKYGKDEQDARTFMSSYSFNANDMESFYNVFTEVMEMYMRSGKTFSTRKKEDLICNLSIKKVEKKENVGVMKTKDVEIKYHSESGEHYKVKAKSPCPNWKKLKK